MNKIEAFRGNLGLPGIENQFKFQKILQITGSAFVAIAKYLTHKLTIVNFPYLLVAQFLLEFSLSTENLIIHLITY